MKNIWNSKENFESFSLQKHGIFEHIVSRALSCMGVNVKSLHNYHIR